MRGIFIWWPGAESNCRHEDFQSTALPTELPGRIYYEPRIKPTIGCAVKHESRIEAMLMAISTSGFIHPGTMKAQGQVIRQFQYREWT